MLTSDFKQALTHLEAGRASDALPILARIVAKWPNYAAAQVAYARALQESGAAEASFRAWTEAEALVSHSGVVHSGLVSAAASLFRETSHSGHDDAPISGAPEAVEVDSPAEEPSEEPSGSAGQEGPEEQQDDGITSDEAADAESPDTAAGTPPEEDMPEFAEETAMDPALFVPIAVPVDEPSIPDTDEARWTEDPARDTELPDSTERPKWEGEYTGDTGDGAGADFDLESEQGSGDVEFDRLIDELESARIVPVEDPSSVPAPDLSDDIDDVVSETLARIYATQKQFAEAARVYERLALENPDRADEFESKASEMRDRSQ